MPYEEREVIEVSDNEVKWYRMRFVSMGEDGVIVEGDDWKYGRFNVGPMKFHRKVTLDNQ
jgi:hypothetical protein